MEPRIIVDVTYHPRDIFSLLAVVGRVLSENGRAEEIGPLVRKVFGSTTYAGTISLLNEYVLLKGLTVPDPYTQMRIQ